MHVYIFLQIKSTEVILVNNKFQVYNFIIHVYTLIISQLCYNYSVLSPDFSLYIRT